MLVELDVLRFFLLRRHRQGSIDGFSDAGRVPWVDVNSAGQRARRTRELGENERTMSVVLAEDVFQTRRVHAVPDGRDQTPSHPRCTHSGLDRPDQNGPGQS